MKTHSIQAENLYTSEEVSEYLHLSLRTIQRLLQSGSLKSYKIHGQYRIKGLDLLSYLDGVRRDPEQPIESDKPAQILDLLTVHSVALEVAEGLIPLVNPESNMEFMPALQELRKRISLELGFVLPGVRLADSDTLKPSQYRFCVQGQPVARGALELAAGMAEAQAALLGHLDQVVRQYAHEIISREEVAVMVERVRQVHGVVVDEVLSLDGPQPGKVTIGQLTRILRALLADRVSIRNLPLILETLADALESVQQPEQLVEKIRQGLARQLCAPLADEDGVIPVLALEPASEEALKQAFIAQDASLSTLSAALQTKLAKKQSSAAALICAVELRPRLRELLRRHFGQLQILSYQEIERDYRIKLVASIEI